MAPSPLKHAADAFFAWWTPPAPAARLASVRVLAGVYALGYFALRARHLAAVARLPAAQFHPVGLASLATAPLPAPLVYASVAAAALAAIAFAFGWRYRVTGPLFATLLLWVTSYRNSWGMIFHTDNLAVAHALVLGFSPAADALSSDAGRRGAPPPPDGHRYGFPLRLLCLITAVTYVLAGVAKLRNSGLDWASGETLRVWIGIDNLRKMELGDLYSPLGFTLLQHPWVFPPFGAFTLAVEFGAPLALAGRRPAAIWCACAWLFHVGVLACMGILFAYPLSGIAFAPFFNAERLTLGKRWRLATRPPATSP
jgi:vitamin K-dependent gamma-carboxylase-like protein